MVSTCYRTLVVLMSMLVRTLREYYAASVVHVLHSKVIQSHLKPQQVWDVDRLIRARNPGAVFTTTERADVTWQTLRSITYSPTLGQEAMGSASVQEASLVRSFKGRTTVKASASRVSVTNLQLILLSLTLSTFAYRGNLFT